MTTNDLSLLNAARVSNAIETVRQASDRFDHRGTDRHDPNRDTLPERIVIDAIDRVQVLANELKAMGVVSVYESSLELGELIEEFLVGNRTSLSCPHCGRWDHATCPKGIDCHEGPCEPSTPLSLREGE